MRGRAPARRAGQMWRGAAPFTDESRRARIVLDPRSECVCPPPCPPARSRGHVLENTLLDMVSTLERAKNLLMWAHPTKTLLLCAVLVLLGLGWYGGTFGTACSPAGRRWPSSAVAVPARPLRPLGFASFRRAPSACAERARASRRPHRSRAGGAEREVARRKRSSACVPHSTPRCLAAPPGTFSLAGRARCSRARSRRASSSA